MSLVMDVLSKAKQQSPSSFQSENNVEPVVTVQSFKFSKTKKQWVSNFENLNLAVISLVLVSVIGGGYFFFMLSRTTVSSFVHSSVAAQSTKPAAASAWNLPINVLKEGNNKRSSSLEGVVLGEKEPYCLIAGKILKIGDSWEQKIITEITETGVSLKSLDGKLTFLNLQK